MDDGEILTAVIGAIFLGILGMLRLLLPYVAKRNGSAKAADVADPLSQSGSFPAAVLPADVLQGMQAFLNDQKDRQPATQGDIEALSTSFTTTIGGHGEKIDSIKTLLEEHIKEDRDQFSKILGKDKAQ